LKKKYRIEIYNFTSENSSVGIREFRNLYIIINVGMHLVFWILFAIDFSVVKFNFILFII